MLTRSGAILVLLTLAMPLVAQVYVPDSDPTVGTCNVIPFGASATFSAGYTYVGRVPASSMDPSARNVRDVAFAPCGTGTWSAPRVQIAIGHIASPQPCPFNFPTIAGGVASSIGSFLDLTVVHDGPFSWNQTLDTWSPMGLGGTGFVWDGVHDVGFFITYQSANVSWTGSFHRTSTIPTRSYAGGYQAAASTTCDAASGLKMELIVGQPEWETNGPTASLTINGVVSDGSGPAVTSSCVGQPAMVAFQSTLLNHGWDLVGTVGTTVVPGSGGGIVTGSGTQVVNINVADPSLFFLNGGALYPPFFPFSVLFPTPPTEVDGQLIVLNPGSADFYSLSQAGCLQPVVGAPGPSVPGPTADDGNVTVDVTANCWVPGGINFCGVNYAQIHVSSNGRVMFNASDTDFSATIAEALTDDPFVGSWMDLAPNTGGSITISNPSSNVVRVDWTGVPYFAEAGTANSFSIVLDGNTNSATLAGLSGIQNNPLTSTTSSDGHFLGLSCGNLGATDPGAATFGPPPLAAVGGPTDMLYEFNAAGTVAAIAAGVNNIRFIPVGGAGGYAWFSN